MKLCVDCRFHKEAKGSDSQPAIMHACTAILDLVTGEQRDVDCQEARAAPWLCGTEGNLFKFPERAAQSRLVDDPNSASGKRLEPIKDFDPLGQRRDLKPGRSDG
jgi:hypothetical protein